MAQQMPLKNIGIRTEFGPIGLRSEFEAPRQKYIMKVSPGGDKTIQSKWLQGEAQNEVNCQRFVKQAMLIAATHIKLRDATDAFTKMSETEKATIMREAKARLEKLQRGEETINVDSHKRRVLAKVYRTEERTRSLMVKFSHKPCCAKRERCFIIDGGDLKVYRNNYKNAPITKDTCALVDCTANLENRVLGTYQKPYFEADFKKRLVVRESKRTAQNKSPFYLYGTEKQLTAWNRAFKMARILVGDNDRKCMTSAISRATSGSLLKAFICLSKYFQEMRQTGDLVRTMAKRLVETETARGWQKLKLVFQKENMKEERSKAQQVWAARFMIERMTQLRGQTLHPIGQIRESVVTRIQNSFRLYRDSKIFDRSYPIGTKVVSRMRKAKQGFPSDVHIETLTCQQTLRLSLTDRLALEDLRTTQKEGPLDTKKSTYSEVQSEPVSSMDIRMSDNFQSMLFYQNEGGPEMSQLSKTKFSNFVCVDRISCVVLNTCPKLGGGMATKEDAGVWCTIYGPRVAYGRCLPEGWDAPADKASNQQDDEKLGAKDGFAVPKALADPRNGASKIEWIVGAIERPSLTLTSLGQTKFEKPSSTFAVLHVLGFSFKSKEQKDLKGTYSFEGDMLAKVPVSKDQGAQAALDTSMIGVEIFSVSDSQDTSKPTGTETLLMVGSQKLVEAFGIKSFKDGSLTKKDLSISLLQAWVEVDARREAVATMTFSFGLTTDAFRPEQAPCITPEFAGGGFGTTLYTSHRGAWYDPVIGLGDFRVDHVPNFVELKLGQLRLDKKTGESSKAKATCIRVRASIDGVAVTSQPMHRAKETWMKVAGIQHADPDALDFSGTRLCLPLPPGCWKSKEESTAPDKEDNKSKDKSQDAPADRPTIRIEIIEGEEEPGQPYTYEQVSKSGGNPKPGNLKTILYASIRYEQHIMVDQVKNLNCFLGKDEKIAPVLNAYSNAVMNATTLNQTEDVLNVDCVLRDRDHVRRSMGKVGDRRDLYVGDKVMVMVESPLEYPSCAMEFRQRFVQGLAHGDVFKKCPEELQKFSDAQAKKGGWPGGSSDGKACKLRSPATGLEYISSNLSTVLPKIQFKQGNLPSYCQDVLPHKYVCPLGEKQFINEARPGVYSCIMDDLADKIGKAGGGAGSGGSSLASTPKQRVVEELSHVIRQIPATLLATYANGTCDLELTPEFMENWRRMATCKYVLPGKVMGWEPVEKKEDASPGAVAQDKLPKKARVVLKGVPTSQVCGTHAAGFHVFHSDFTSVEEKTFKARPAPVGDFDLRGEEAVINTGFTLAAGPLPPDASASACQYEWSLSVRSASAFEMYQFVASLRQAVRCDQLIQATRVEALHTQMTGAVLPKKPVHQVSPTSGALEIVLVEARRLRPLDFEQTWKHQESLLVHDAKKGPLREETSKGLIGTKPAGGATSSTPEGHKLSTFVEFRLLNNGEEVPVKGSKVQSAPQYDGTDSPCWAAKKGLESSGGWAFKTGVIDSADKPDLQLDFEVKWVSYAQASTLGAIQVPVFKPMAQFGNRCLADATDCFKSIWLPLMAEVEGQVCHAPLGQIHVLTHWIPPNKLHPPPGQLNPTVKQEMGKQATLHMEMRMKGTRLREVIGGSFDFEAQYATYNPNIVREGMPESPPEFFERNVEALYNTVPYLKCLNIRQEMVWNTFEEKFLRGKFQSIAEARAQWVQEEFVPPGQEGVVAKKVTPLTDLEELIKTGIPNTKRERYWQDLVGSTASRGGQNYKALVERGLAIRSDAMLQLQEDGFHLAGQWESTHPPNYKNQDELLKKLQKAQNICTALIAYGESGVDYCESVLVLAFFLILPHGVRMPELSVQNSPTWVDDIKKAINYAGLELRDVPKSSVVIKNAKEQNVMDDVIRVFSGAPAMGSENLVFPLTVRDDTETGLSEEAAFWLLVRLVRNGAFKAYFGKDEVWTGNAAMKDVSLLETFLCQLDNELWIYLNAVGFHLSTVFYGAFMRLFATYMPVATVFCFWDMLFAETSKEPNVAQEQQFPGHGARQMLVTFAYAIVKSKKSELLLCQSASEVADLLLGVLGSLYDCDTVSEFIDAAQLMLWGYNGKISKRVLPKHKDHEEAWDDAHKAVNEQNLILKELMHSRELGSIRGGGYRDQRGVGVSASQLVESVIPVLRQAVERIPAANAMTNAPAGGKDDTNKPELDKDLIYGMYRPLPRSESILTTSWMDKTRKHFEKTFWPEIPLNPYFLKAEAQGKPATASATEPPLPGLEPYFNDFDFQRVLEQEIPNWQDQAKRIWNAFTNRRDRHHGVVKSLNPLAKAGITIDNPSVNAFIVNRFVKDPHNKHKDDTERISLNELFLSMIFLSKGTIGDKAAAVFSVFAHSDTVSKEEHHIAPSQLAKTITEKSDLKDANANAGKTTAPDDAVKRNCALHFTVFSKHHKEHQKEEIGHVYIPSVGLYTGASVEEYIEFNIWPSEERIQEQQALKKQDPMFVDTGPDVIGEITVSISWSPNIEGSQDGQLAIRMKSVLFYPPIENNKMNPWVEVKTVTSGREETIKRWDPRGGLMSTDMHASALQVGAFGGHIVFERTMTQHGPYGNEQFRQFISHGDNQGFIGGKWQWNSTWGKQLSVENYKFPSPSATTMPKSDNSMYLKFARYIVHCLLTRTLVNVSNRQCMLIADSVFNRHGAVPGILGAILVRSSSVSDYKLSLTKLKASLDEKKITYTDVTGELALEQERQMVENGGTFNLFAPAFMEKHDNKITLQDMNITDPGGETVLAVRFVRGGDGERVTKYIKISGGSVQGLADDTSKIELELDLPPSTLMCTKVTKEEFVNCFLNSPLLGESLRDMGAYDQQNPERKTVELDVMIVDPRHEEEAKEQEHASHFNQTLLAEVWDDDTFSKDYLGEAWLPSLSTIPVHPRDYVLPLYMPDFSAEPENGPSRHHRHKEAYDIKTTKYKAEGEIYVKLGWEFPAYEMGPDGKSVVAKSGKKDKETINDSVLLQQKLNTGILTIKIDHGRHLRRSDARRGRDCDPQVQVFVRNDAMDHWRRKPVARTNTVKNNRNPKWDHKEEAVEIVQGDFEQKFPPRGETMFEAAKYAMKSRKTKRREDEERRLNVVKSSGPTVSITFGMGEQHGMDVYMNDSIREFKAKLLQACKIQAKSKSGQERSIYEEVKIGPKHLVTVYVEPHQITRMSEAGGRAHSTEMEHRKKIALEDPKNWQPLDPSKTFEMYRTRYKFGFPRKPVKIRIMEATEKLKMVNLMYKEFEKERNKPLSIDKNDDASCFGWAKYTHGSDESSEWRRAIIGNATDTKEEKGKDAPKYSITWLAKTFESSASKAPVTVDRSSVLLQPRLPKMDHYVHPAHEKLLEQAKGLRAMGKSDYEIQDLLNHKLEDDQQPAKQTPSSPDSPRKSQIVEVAPRITVDIVQNYLAHHA